MLIVRFLAITEMLIQNGVKVTPATLKAANMAYERKKATKQTKESQLELNEMNEVIKKLTWGV